MMTRAKGLAAVAAVATVLLVSGAVHALEYRYDALLASYRWEEHVQASPPIESGPMALFGGWVGGSPSAAHPSLRLRGDACLMLGRVNFDTALLLSPSTRVSTNTTYVGTSQEGSVGWRFTSSPGVIFEPFLGVAYRWWLRHIESTSNVTGYDEWYRILVARIGIRSEIPLSDRLTGYWTFSGDPTLWAREDINFQEISGETFHVKSGKRVGWTFDGGLRSGNVEVGVFWQALRLGQSTSDLSNVIPRCCLQPKSDQDIVGLKVGAWF